MYIFISYVQLFMWPSVLSQYFKFSKCHEWISYFFYQYLLINIILILMRDFHQSLFKFTKLKDLHKFIWTLHSLNWISTTVTSLFLFYGVVTIGKNCQTLHVCYRLVDMCAYFRSICIVKCILNILILYSLKLLH